MFHVNLSQNCGLFKNVAVKVVLGESVCALHTTEATELSYACTRSIGVLCNALQSGIIRAIN